MPAMTREEQDLRRRRRGCGLDCSCQFCCSDDMDAFLTERGQLQVLHQATQVAAETRRAVRSTAKPRTGKSKTGGAPTRKAPRRRKGWRPASAPQLQFIARLWAEREVGDAAERQRLAEWTYDSEFGVREASALIDQLQALPRRAQPAVLPQAGTRLADPDAGRIRRGEPHPDLIEKALYWLAGAPFRVQRSRESGRLYAVRVWDDGSTSYEEGRGKICLLDPAQRLTLEQARALSRRTGTCCSCGARLTDPNSIDAGIGPVCARRFG